MKLDINNLECELLNKIDLKDSKSQIIELLNEKADRIDLEKLKASKVDKSMFESFRIQMDDTEKIGN